MNERDYAPLRLKGNGVTKEFAYKWKTLDKNCLVIELESEAGEIKTLKLGKDYDVDVAKMGGNVILTTPPSEDETIIISRKTSQYQGKGYSTSSGFQGSEIENSFDKVSCNLQEMDYNIEAFKESFAGEVDVTIVQNKTETDNKIQNFENEVNSKIEQVNAAVQKLNRLDEVLETCENYANSAEEQSIIAQQQATQAGDSANAAETCLNEITAKHEEIISDVNSLREQSLADVAQSQSNATNSITNLQSSVISNIQSLGIFMKDDRLFYKDSQGIVREFRNDFGGIAPMPLKQRDIKEHEYIEEKIVGSIEFNYEDATTEEIAEFVGKTPEEISALSEDNLQDLIDEAIAQKTAELPREKVIHKGFLLTWTDPDDSAYMDNIYCTWGNTLIVRKEGAYPESPFDGAVVVNETVRNTYAIEGYFDEVDTSKDWKYRAFPRSINKVYSQDEKNKFGYWCYAYTEVDTESNPEKRITYLEDNKYFSPNYMDFTNDRFVYADWENSPFYSWDYIRPCMVYNANAFDEEGNCLIGQVMEYLDPNDHSKTIDGKPSHVADQNCNANAMVEKRKIFTKVVINGDVETVYFSNVKLDDEYECYQCKRADGTYNEFYYTPMFDGSLINNRLVSLAGNLTPISGKNAQNEIDYARANGNGYDTEIWSDTLFEERVFKLLFKNTNSQVVLGAGKSNGGSDVGACLKSGTMLTKGQNWGSSSNAVGVKFRYRENFYASQWQRHRGIIFINGKPYVKMTRSTIDGSTVSDYNITGDGYIPLDIPVPTGTSGGYVSKTTSTKYGKFAAVVSGSSSTYLCDGRWFNNSGVMYPYRGGSSNGGLLCGAFCWYSNHAASHAGWSVGAALSFKPL